MEKQFIQASHISIPGFPNFPTTAPASTAERGRQFLRECAEENGQWKADWRTIDSLIDEWMMSSTPAERENIWQFFSDLSFATADRHAERAGKILMRADQWYECWLEGQGE